MAIQTQATGFTKVLIGDQSATGDSATPTRDGDFFAAAALEVQSSTGGFLLPRLTNDDIEDVEVSTNSYFAPGTIAWNSNTDSMISFDSSGAVPGIQYVKTIVTTDDIKAMYAGPIEIAPSPGVANTLIVIDSITLVYNFGVADFDGASGGGIKIQYGDTVNGGGPSAIGTQTVDDVIDKDLITLKAESAIVTCSSAKDGSAAQIVTVDSSENEGIYISNLVAAFDNVGGSTSNLTVHMFYRTLSIAQ